jgi:hypothetical protein
MLHYTPADADDATQMLDEVGRWILSVTGSLPDPGKRLVEAVVDAAAQYNPPPRLGDVISGERIDECPIGTTLRSTQTATAAVRSVHGWLVTGRHRSEAQDVIEADMRLSKWRVVEVPEQNP